MADGTNGARGKSRKAPSAWVPERPDRRGAPPASLGEVLLGTDEFLAKRSGAAIPRAEWTGIVGPRIAGRTRVGKLYKGILTVKVASSAWANELSYLKQDLLRKLQRAGHDISDLRFRVDNIVDDSPGAAGRRGYPSGRRPVTKEAELPTELIERLKKIDDPNLRAAIAEAAKARLARR